MEEVKKYNFALSLQEAQLIMAALKKLPMEVVEFLVKNMDSQFSEQVQAELKTTTEVKEVKKNKAANA